MTRRNDKRNNRRNSRQRNNNSELNPFAQMIFGAILGKGAEIIADALKEKAEEKTEDKPHTGFQQEGNHVRAACVIKNDGSATEIPIPDGFQIFISEDGKPMIRKLVEGVEEPTPDAAEGNPVTYDDICKELYSDNTTFWFNNTRICKSDRAGNGNYNDINNCTSEAQAKRVIAFNKLLNIAKYLNNGWGPDFYGLEEKWTIVKERKGFTAKYNQFTNDASVYFKSKQLTYEAICLMGEDSLNDLFSTDW